ncbi:MAG: penicillin-binding transpeptidase domain-containing protein [Oscillospiraceae bacterium]|nr:penicillin-binding transpeptidase domain-containing protein [Oscillospiraceae bacterium]
MNYQPTAKMKRKLNIFVLGIMVAFAVWTVVNLYDTAITQNARFQAMANDSQFMSESVKANRGNIYDRNGKFLAQSATVYSINIDPNMLSMLNQERVDSETGLTEYERQLEACISILCEELSGVTREDVLKKFENVGHRWANIARQVEKPAADKILARAGEEKLGRLIFTELDTKRYYPQNELAAAVIGFTNAEGNGVYGVEAYYNDYLKGVDGKIITATDGVGNEMPYKNDKIYEAQDGNSLFLTLDMTLQFYVEKYLEESVINNDVRNRASAIMMDANTGAILAMASSPGYDLNDRNAIYSKRDISILSAIEDEQLYREQYAILREQQWKNKAVTELYYPGSVFKVITGAAALEEKTSGLHSSFYCSQMDVSGTKFHCWTRGSHGTQNFTEAMTNSCNPAFIQIGQALGADRFAEYFRAFGLTERTGIDLPGEAGSIFTDVSTKGPVELASSAFGQTNKITPIQMITSYAATVNGGYLVQPYVVSKIVDTNGNVIKTTDRKVKRQVISEESSAAMRQVLEDVVNNKGGSNAYIKGYSIGGKSGTSQKQDENNRRGVENLYVSSYCAFAPADNPEIIFLVMVDEPMGKDHNGAHVYYGSLVAVPVVTDVLKEALPYLGYYPKYTNEELAALGIALPDVEGEPFETARATLEALGLQVTVIGEGKNVISQIPPKASLVPKNGRVVLYTEMEQDTVYATVPDVIGLSLQEANRRITNAGLNFSVGGGAAGNAGATAFSQSYSEGEKVPEGTVIEVVFAVRDLQ